MCLCDVQLHGSEFVASASQLRCSCLTLSDPLHSRKQIDFKIAGGGRSAYNYPTWCPLALRCGPFSNLNKFSSKICPCGAAASRAGLPLRGSGPDNVWQLSARSFIFFYCSLGFGDG